MGKENSNSLTNSEEIGQKRWLINRHFIRKLSNHCEVQSHVHFFSSACEG